MLKPNDTPITNRNHVSLRSFFVDEKDSEVIRKLEIENAQFKDREARCPTMLEAECRAIVRAVQEIADITGMLPSATPRQIVESVQGLSDRYQDAWAEKSKLSAAIQKHRDEFPDEACMGEEELWSHVTPKEASSGGKFKVETFCNLNWEDAGWVDEKSGGDTTPARFATLEEADAAINEFIRDTDNAFSQGFLVDPYFRSDYRAVPVTQ